VFSVFLHARQRAGVLCIVAFQYYSIHICFLRTVCFSPAADFVRLAARCGAIIVPFAAVGADDAYDVFMDVDEVLEAPVLGDLVRVRPLHD
jgi:hypothetical protein